MRAENRNDDGRSIRAATLRQAAKIAESEASLLAAEYWNLACQRVAQRLEAQAARLEAEVALSLAAPETMVSTRHQCRVPTTRGLGRFHRRTSPPL